MKSASLPRSVRNNNPGNLRKTNANWIGKVSPGSDPSFEQFSSPYYGFRAMAKDLVNDYKKGKKSIQAIISEYAPPHENNTSSYASKVAKEIGVNIADLLSETFFRNNLHKILYRMHIIEAGKQYWSLETIKTYTQKFDF